MITQKFSTKRSPLLSITNFSEIGLRQTMKTRWFVYDKKAGKLKYYRDEAHELQGELPIGQLDLSTATFCYDVETDTSGEFTIV